jgi:hypothetical protein
MRIPFSDHFARVYLEPAFNAIRSRLPDSLRTPEPITEIYSETQFRGMPFVLGVEEGNNVILLDGDPVTIPLDGRRATYLVFAHVVEDRPTVLVEGMGDDIVDGNVCGGVVSDYVLEYADGTTAAQPIQRRFGIQQATSRWGASPFASVPVGEEQVYRNNTEDVMLERVPIVPYGRGECRGHSSRDLSRISNAWLYALPNPHPDRELQAIRLEPKTERSVIYGLTTTELTEHPLRNQARRKLLLTLPDGIEFNAIGELDDIDIDLGYVISARRQTVYDQSRWNLDVVDLQPEPAADSAVIEYAAHPAAKLYVGSAVFDLVGTAKGVVEIAPAHRPVTVMVIDKTSRVPVGVRIHFHGAAGEYLPPKGYHRSVNSNWFEDNYGEFVNGANQYAYIRGECIVDLPLGTVYVEISRGYEVTPIRESVEITADTDELTFELDRVLDWRSRGWVTADTHVHFLTPTTAVLEGEAEDVNVVNLLASQWGEMFSNTSDFDGCTTHSNTLSGNNGEFLARVGTENRMQVLGHISLLGYSGEMIHPLCSGGMSESALGDFQEVTMADWAQRCIDQNGMVVMPHAPNPQCERVADVVLDLVHAIEIMSFNPSAVQLPPHAVADWYRFQNMGYHLPLTGGSDKMAASSRLGGLRTYTQLDDLELTYENWMAATKAGNTFVTVGPLVEMHVDGNAPGSKIKLSETGGTLTVSWRVESVNVPIDAVEVVVGGRTISDDRFDEVMAASGSREISIDVSTWVAVRVRGRVSVAANDDIAAHTSAVQIFVGDKPIYRQEDAVEMLRQIEGAIAYVDTIAARPDADRYRKMRLTLESAYNRMHQRMHNEGVFHEHSAVHNHGYEH